MGAKVLGMDAEGRMMVYHVVTLGPNQCRHLPLYVCQPVLCNQTTVTGWVAKMFRLALQDALPHKKQRPPRLVLRAWYTEMLDFARQALQAHQQGRLSPLHVMSSLFDYVEHRLKPALHLHRCPRSR